jgi:hypothetical protein
MHKLHYKRPPLFLYKNPGQTTTKKNPLRTKKPWAQGKGVAGGRGVGEGDALVDDACVTGGIVLAANRHLS